jgi:hypothetical protein
MTHFNKRDLDSERIRDLMRDHIAIGLDNFHKFIANQ